jgi:hypothetical protein
MYGSMETKNPLYSIPHFSLTMIGLPVSSFRKGLGFTTVWKDQSRALFRFNN